MGNGGGFVLVLIGCAGLFFAAQALAQGRVVMVWSRLGGWATLGSEFERDRHPAAFWAATLVYGLGGAGLALGGVVRLLHPGG